MKLGLYDLYMVQEEYDIVDDPAEIEFIDGSLHINVIVNRYEEEYQGSSRGEEYYERTDFDGDVLDVQCPINYIYKESDPNEDYAGSDAVDFINSNSWASQKVVDVETMEFKKDGELWIASFDPDPLSEYRI